MKTQTCSKCDVEYPLTSEYFHTNRRNKTGFKYACKECNNAYYRNNPTARGVRRKVSELTDEERQRRRDKAKEYDRTYTERLRAEWLEQYGELPLCACGCGEQVNFAKKLRGPYMYVGNHYNRMPEHAQIASETSLRRHREKIENGDCIEIEAFRDACRKIKADKGWTWKEMADHGGISYGHMKNVMSEKRTISVTYEWAWAFFRRIAGMPAPPSVYQMRERKRDVAADYGLDTLLA